MIIEKQLENQIVGELSQLIQGSSTLSCYQIVSSRQTNDQTEDDETDGVIAVTVGMRSHDAFSLSPISVPCSVSIVTRIEKNPTGDVHEDLVETIMNKLSYWHKYPDAMQSALQGPKFMAGELRMDGGTGRTLDKDNAIWTDVLSFTIRGAEKFTL